MHIKMHQRGARSEQQLEDDNDDGVEDHGTR